MFHLVRKGILLLSLVATGWTISVPAWAIQAPCALPDQVKVGGYLAGEILPLEDLQKAVLCAVNRAGRDAMGESTFWSIFDARIDQADMGTIQITHRFSKLEPYFNQKNMYLIKFEAIYEEKFRSIVHCEAVVEYQMLPAKHVVLTLSACRANSFNTAGRFRLEAWTPYVSVK